MQVSIAEAAQRLGVSKDTIRRRIKDRTLKAHQKERGKSWIWQIDLPETAASFDEADSLFGKRSEISTLRELADTLKLQLEARTREVQELHLLLGQKALEAPHRGWLRRLWPL